MEEEPTPSAPIPGLKTSLTLQPSYRRQARQRRSHSDDATGISMEDQTPSAPFDGIKLILTPQGILRRQAGLPLPASVAATGSDIRDEPTTAVEGMELLLAITLPFTEFSRALQKMIPLTMHQRARTGLLPCIFIGSFLYFWWLGLGQHSSVALSINQPP